MNYVRYYTKLLSLTDPSVCENGGIIYYPSIDKSKMHPVISSGYLHSLRNLEDKIMSHVARIYPGYSLEKGKQTMISLNPPKGIPIVDFFNEVSSFITKNYDEYIVTRSASAVDISLKNIDKSEGLRIVLQELRLIIRGMRYRRLNQ